MPDNRTAFLDMLAYSEIGPKLLKNSDNGYNCIVGGSLFHSYANHPRKYIAFKGGKLVSSAAGRYQILARYYDSYKKLLNLPDFSPASQDAIALQMIKEQGALPDIDAGHFDEAVAKCSNIWASLPGARYGQHENELASLQDAYISAGGTVA